MSDNMETTAGNGTGTQTQNAGNESQNNGSGKTFTQDEVNQIIAARLAKEQKKFEGVDVEEYRTLKTLKEQREEEEALKRNQFDEVLKKTKEKSNQEIEKLRSKLTEVRVDGALIDAAAKYKAVAPNHIAKLLKNSVKLDDDGQPVVLDEKGEIRYNTDKGEPYTIDDLVKEFIAENPYFKSSGPAGTGSSGNTETKKDKEVTLANLDMTNPKDRETYRKLKREGKI